MAACFQCNGIAPVDPMSRSSWRMVASGVEGNPAGRPVQATGAAGSGDARPPLRDASARAASSGPKHPARPPADVFKRLLDTLEARDARILLLSALLPEVTPEAVGALAGDSDAAQILERLARDFPFFFRESAASPVYTHHPSLRAYLRDRARETLPVNDPVDTLWRCLDAYEMVRRSDDGVFAPARAGASTVPVRLVTLGRFRIVHQPPVKVRPRKQAQKPLALIKVLVALGAADVPLHRLADMLWPHADGDCAQARLTVTLYRARRLLGSAHAIHVENALASLNPAHVFVDALELPRILHDPGLEQLAATAACDRVLTTYPGPFLPAEDEPWILPCRERLAAIFADAVMRLGRRLEASEDDNVAAWFYRQALEREPSATAIRDRLTALG